MAHSELFARYIWLADLIYRHDGITRKEINRRWSQCADNYDHEEELTERSFHRHKQAIQDLFGITIACRRGVENTYHILNREAIHDDEIKMWLLNSFAVKSSLTQGRQLRHRILLEPVPSGTQFLTPIIEAMRDNAVIVLDYKSYNMEDTMAHTVEPYCLKIYRQRWYVVGRRVEHGMMRTFALDRIRAMRKTSEHFEMPADFDAEAYFANSIGIMVQEKEPVKRVILRARNGMENYLRSLPLHHSQCEIETGDSFAIFELYLKQSDDLVRELLSCGPDVEVLAPRALRNKMRQLCEKMNNNYSE